ncbi:hypothetical protein J6590_054811 [Homalodisca vitripennis]|nr:hypothetical protein J6590_054811 [Homalodisca vitripennis]
MVILGLGSSDHSSHRSQHSHHRHYSHCTVLLAGLCGLTDGEEHCHWTRDRILTQAGHKNTGTAAARPPVSQTLACRSSPSDLAHIPHPRL